jgi:hypothetical protein
MIVSIISLNSMVFSLLTEKIREKLKYLSDDSLRIDARYGKTDLSEMCVVRR